MSLLQKFQDNIRQQNLFSLKDKLILAVSGGVDSVVLCELCHQAGYDFAIAHCNFKLRGKESERDKEFVKNLAKKYKVAFHLKEYDTEKFASENKMSIQEAARVLRYEWFEDLVNAEWSMVNEGTQKNIHHSPPDSYRVTIHLLTAHHADDNAETVLMNFCRGTGLHGLTGIPVSYGHIRRPLLWLTKEELIQFAKENKLDFVEDTSNLSSKYTRNLFRNEIIPAIGKVFPQVKQNIVDNISRFSEIEKLYRIAVADVKKKLVKQKGAEWHIPVKQLMGYHNRALIYEIIADFGFTEKQIDEVIKLAGSESGKYIDSPALAWRIIRHRHWLIISPVSSAGAATIIEEKDKSVLFENGWLKLEQLQTTNFKPQTSNDSACLDAKNIRFPLILRKWKTGDYFYPLGMKKKKKLARLFIDQKLSKSDKEKVWVLESDRRILWVIGYRIDERFKVTEKSNSFLKITLHHS